MAILRMFKHSNILENNMVQTQASAAGTLSAIIFILPGLLMLGYWQGFPFWQTLLLCACGALSGSCSLSPCAGLWSSTATCRIRKAGLLLKS